MLFSLFINFFKIGLFTFGGGYAMIAQIREEVVAKRNWLTEDELIEVIAIAESTPGHWQSTSLLLSVINKEASAEVWQPPSVSVSPPLLLYLSFLCFLMLSLQINM